MKPIYWNKIQVTSICFRRQSYDKHNYVVAWIYNFYLLGLKIVLTLQNKIHISGLRPCNVFCMLYFRIRSKWGCGGSKPNSYCNRELRIEDEVWLIHRGVPHGPPPKWGHINLGFVLPTDDYLHWKLRKVSS